MKPLNMIKKTIFTARFHRINKHYATDPVIGQRAKIEREGKEPVDVILYFPKEQKNAPVFVQIHGGAWVGLDAVDDDRYCQRLSEELAISAGRSCRYCEVAEETCGTARH